MLIGERAVITPDFSPITSTETALNYTYDKASIINIDEYGFIHAIAAGTVTVNSTTDYGVYSAFVVTVTDPDFITRGDINDDGEIDVWDLASIKKYILKTELLSNNARFAADMNKDTIVSISDLLMLKKLLLGITSV